jgi:hypothetical protein
MAKVLILGVALLGLSPGRVWRNMLRSEKQLFAKARAGLR